MSGEKENDGNPQRKIQKLEQAATEKAGTEGGTRRKRRSHKPKRTRKCRKTGSKVRPVAEGVIIRRNARPVIDEQKMKVVEY